MPKPIKHEDDPTELALNVMRRATGDDAFPKVTVQPEPSQETISAVMRALGKRGGRKGGPARAKKLTAKRRREIALRAARSRWDRAR